VTETQLRAVATSPPAEPGSTPPLQLEHARYQYAGARSWVLDGIDLAVAAGEVMAVVGANDSGKSTLGLVASGLAPTVVGGNLDGVVELVGRPTAGLRPHEAAQLCGVLFQNPTTQLSGTSHTVWEELAFGPRNVGLAVDEVVDRVEEVMRALGIEGLAPRDPARLSGGQAQLVALASVLTLRPRCLVLDEPTSQLDPEGTRVVGEAIRRLAGETGTAILLIEHKTGLLARTADRCIALADGRIVLNGSIGEVLGDERLIELGVDPPPEVRLRRALRGAKAPPDVVERVIGAIRGAAA
jgi:energy-coupling factor transporter ATP-binding protein EcfA2